MSCRFISKKTQEQCSDIEVLPFGFCKKHSKTLQGKQAKEVWLKQRESNKEENKQEKNKEKEKHKDDKQEKHKENKEDSEEEVKVKKEKEIKKKVSEEKKIVIKKNNYGRFEEPKTHIVFDPSSQKAYAVQGKGGELLPLTERHIDICEKYGWKVLSNPYLSESD